MIKIDNFGIRAKIAQAPALLIVLLFALAGYGAFILNNTVHLMADQNRLADQADQVNALVTATLTTQSNLYRLVSIASMEDDGKKISAMAGGVNALIDTVTPQAAKLGDMAKEAGLSAAETAEAVATLQRFIKSARTVTEMADSDVGTALTMMGPVDRNFEKLADVLHKVQKNINQVSETAANSGYDDARMAQWTFLSAALMVGAVATALTWRLSNRISTPIRALTHTMIRLKHRDYGVDVGGQDLKDEIGDMARAVQDFKKGLIAADRLAAEQEAEKRIQLARADRIATLSREFEETARVTLSEVTAASRQMQATSNSMTDIAAQTQQQAMTVSDAATQTAHNVQSVAGAAEQLAASISGITEQVQEASNVAQSAVQEANRVDHIVVGLDHSITKIGEVVQLISDIASQTNLLALNATIEAARAGEAGKGFAVVAGEVKSLANQTAKATTEITAQIQNIQTASRTAVTALSDISHTIESISGISANIADAMDQQGAATRDISISIQQAATGTTLVTHNIKGVTQASAQTGQAAREVLDAADSLAGQANALNQRVDAFLEAVRQA